MQTTATVTHPYPFAEGEKCAHCWHFRAERVPAKHKLEEVTVDTRHPLSAYLCCLHFQHLFGPATADLAGCK